MEKQMWAYKIEVIKILSSSITDSRNTISDFRKLDYFIKLLLALQFN